MISLGQIERSEYNLLGAMNEDEFLSALDMAGANEKRRMFRRLQQQSRSAAAITGKGSRAEFEKRMNLLPADIQQGLAKQTLQAVDTAYYVVRSIAGSKVVKMFKDDDTKVVGVSNISSGKLEKGNHFLLHAIQLQGGTAEPNATVGSVNFGVIPDYVRNGEFEFKGNGTVLLPLTSCEVFNTQGKDTFQGLLILDNPKMISDQRPIEFNIEWADNAPANTYLKVILRGTAVIKA
jgi:hypothetical protein